MNTRTRIRNAASILLAGVIAGAAWAQTGPANLSPVAAGPMDEVKAAPGVNYSQYRQVLIAPVKLSYAPGWFRQMSDYKTAPNLAKALTQADADKIQKALSAAFDRVVPDEFARRGYSVATATGPGVLLVEPTVSQVWITNPYPDMNQRVAVTQSSGHATFEVTLLDSQSGAAVGYSRIRLSTLPIAPQFTQSATSFVRADWEDMFKHWAQLEAGRLSALQGQTVAARVQ
jgi:Protein of unknown function (DUF3313)